MRPLRSWEDFKTTVGGERITIIAKVFEDSFLDYQKILKFCNELNAGAVLHEIRTKAGIIHEQVKARMSKEFGSDPSVEIRDYNGIFGVKFSEEFVCRIKKNNKNGAFSCILTLQQKRFDGQYSIKGISESPTFITLSYKPNIAFAALDGIYVTCRSANGLEWFQKIGGEGASQLSVIFPQQQPVAPRKTRVTPKQNPNRRTDTGTD